LKVVKLRLTEKKRKRKEENKKDVLAQRRNMGRESRRNRTTRPYNEKKVRSKGQVTLARTSLREAYRPGYRIKGVKNNLR